MSVGMLLPVSRSLYYFGNHMEPGEQHWLNRELHSLVQLKETERLWHIPLLASLCVGLPILIGFYLGHPEFGLGACISGFVILYLPPTSVTHRMITLIGASYGFLIAFTLGIATSFHPVVSAVSLGVFAFIVHWVTNYLGMRPPGNFFFLMIAAIAGCMPFDLNTIPLRVGLMALGSMLACTLGFFYSLYITRKYPPVTEPVKRKSRYTSIFESVILGVFMAISVLAGHFMTENNPYWVPVSCMAVMQGVGLQHVWQRSFQRIVGTIIGLGLAWVLLKLEMNMLQTFISIMLLQFIMEMLIVRNYALAVIVMTPLTIFLAESHTPAIDPDILVFARLKDIVIGSLIGAVAGWFVYHEKLRYKAVRQMRKTSVAIGRKIRPH